MKAQGKIYLTDPWMEQYFVDKNETKKYTYGSNHSSLMQCPQCGYRRNRKIYMLHQKGFCCPKCGDGISYPNKFMFNVLEQLNIPFLYEVSHVHNGFEWVGKYRYDFYFETEKQKYFIEMDGHFHKIFDEVKQRDQIKNQLAAEHSIIIIRIPSDYKKDRFNFIKNNILKSDLPSILNFTESNINWELCDRLSNSSLLVEACSLWNSGVQNTLQIALKLHVSRYTISQYLKKGVELKLCNYNPKIEQSKAGKNVSRREFQEKKCKPVAVYDETGITNVFSSASQFSEMSYDIFGVRISRSMITNVCLGLCESSMGLTFKYITQEEYDCYYNEFNGHTNQDAFVYGILCSSRAKPLVVFDNNKLFNVFVSANEAAEKMSQCTGEIFTYHGIKNVCLGRQKQYHGFTFQHITKEEYKQHKMIYNEVVKKEVVC